MKILATDLDRTLLPNGSWPADPQAIDLFNELTAKNEILVVYVTGRNLELTERAIGDFEVRHPDVLIGDVGTTIRKYQAGEWHFDEGWIDHVHHASPRWDNAGIRDALEGITGLQQQEEEHLNIFKQSYYVLHEERERILAEVDARIEGRFDEVIIYSFDSQNGKGLLDVLPDSATKQTALEYVVEEYGVPPGDVVFCGDSGNDIFPLTAGFNGVLVRNADDQLVENVKAALKENPTLRLYFAKGGFKGLNGYYTSGVIEGAYHYGLIED